MNEKTLSSQQTAFLLFMILLGGSYVHVPPTLAHQSAWLSALGGSLVGAYLILVLLHLQSLFPQTSLIRMSEKLLGKVPGKIVGLLYLWAVFIMAISLLQDNCIILVVMFPLLTCLFLRVTLISPAVYTIYKGVSSIGRLGELFTWLTLILTLLAFIITIPRVQPAFLSPLGNPAAIAKGVLQVAGWPFSMVGLLAFFLPLVNDLPDKKKVIYWWYLLAVVILVLKDVLIVGVLSPEILLSSRYPLLEVLRLDTFGGFQRVEMFFFLAWFMMSFFAMLAAYQCLALGGQALFSLSNYGFLVIPLGLGLVVFSLYTFQSDIDFVSLRVLTLPLNSLIPMLFVPTLLLVVAKFRNNL
ncbi:MAG TPA: GerAB/ArcD/ProY family transporter [Syntrophomonadaceae bacterium]|nr:GerAB/ArcD/ProY family transporter [Syntrophomonadaceae bacterium]